MIYTSRFANPELKTGKYTAVRISLGGPRWNTGYTIAGVISDLAPKGLMGKKYEEKAAFEIAYWNRLNAIGVQRIQEQLSAYERLGKDIVLLCFEDVRKGGDNWCHRTIFAQWWREQTGINIPELPDPSTPKR